MSKTKDIARQRIHKLFIFAKKTIKKDPEKAQRYIQIARKIAMRTRLHLPREYQSLICRGCKRFILPGVNCRVRIGQRREPHVIITCFHCGKHSRTPIKSVKKQC